MQETIDTGTESHIFKNSNLAWKNFNNLMEPNRSVLGIHVTITSHIPF